MRLSWKDGSKPFSDQFQDIYYADEDGLAESRYVFLEQNRLPDRFSKTKTFVIGELGFGTGLNFFSTWDLWEKTEKIPEAQLHYFSCEKFPLTKNQIEKALSPWPELSELSEEFLKVYSDLPLGFHTFHFEDLRLTLLIGDVRSSLKQMEARVDAWFLDGFAPTKNEEMWSLETLSDVRRLSAPQASLATYTCAGFIRRNLISLGFQVEKVPGFGRKREMLRGGLKVTSSCKPQGPFEQKRAVIVGGGIAGASIASALSRRNWKIQIIEKRSQLACGASGNEAVITIPSISKIPLPLSRFSWAGYHYLHQLPEIQREKTRLKSGLLLLIDVSSEVERHQTALHSAQIPESVARIVDATEASTLAGLEIKSSALYFSEASCLSLPSFSKSLTKQGASIEFLFGQEVHSVESKNSLWQVYDENRQLLSEADVLVFANAHELSKFELSSWLPLRKVRGQTALLETNPILSALKTILCFDGFLSPLLHSGKHLLGATFDNDDHSTEPRETDNQKLLGNLMKALPQLKSESLSIRSNWVEFRTSVPGQMPIMGELCDEKGASQPGLYVMTALASRGSIYAPLGGEILASHICGESLPIEKDLFEAMSLRRFLKM